MEVNIQMTSHLFSQMFAVKNLQKGAYHNTIILQSIFLLLDNSGTHFGLYTVKPELVVTCILY